MSRFAQHGKVYFVEEPIFDRGWQGLKLSSPIKSLRVITPYVASDLTPNEREQSIAEMLQGFYKANRIEEYVAWYYSPMALGYTMSLFPLLTVYDCMDELSSFNFAPPE